MHKLMYLPFSITYSVAYDVCDLVGQNYSCSSFRLDPLGLRDHPECDFVRGPAFGMIELEFDQTDSKISKVHMQIRDGDTSQVLLQSSLLVTESGCQAMPKP